MCDHTIAVMSTQPLLTICHIYQIIADEFSYNRSLWVKEI